MKKKKIKDTNSLPKPQIQPAFPERSYFLILCLWSAVLAAAFLSLYNIEKRSIWYDEAFSIAYSSLNRSGLLAHIWQHEPNMWFYSVLLKLWLIMGTDEFAVRSLSAVFAVTTVPVVYLIGKRLFDARVGLTAAWLLSVNAFFIRYAQEARSYSLVLCLVCISTYFFIRSIEERSRTSWAIYVIISVLAVYSHFFAAFVILSHAVSILFLDRKEIPPLKDLLIIGCFFFLFLVPFGYLIVSTDSGQINWIPELSNKSLPDLFINLAGREQKPIAILSLLLSLVGLIRLFRMRRNSQNALIARRGLLAFIWLALPIAAAMAVSLFKPIFVDRYFIVCLPALMLLAGLGLAGIHNTRIFWAAASVTLIISIIAVITSYQSPKDDDWRGATGFIYSSAKTGDATIFLLPYNKLAFEYYRSRLPLENDPLVYAYPSVPFLEMLEKRNTRPLNQALLNSLRRDNRRVWLILCDEKFSPDGSERLQQSLNSLYSFKRTSNFGGVTLLLYYN
jgi:mannosyltransferase